MITNRIAALHFGVLSLVVLLFNVHKERYTLETLAAMIGLALPFTRLRMRLLGTRSEDATQVGDLSAALLNFNHHKRRLYTENMLFSRASCRPAILIRSWISLEATHC